MVSLYSTPFIVHLVSSPALSPLIYSYLTSYSTTLYFEEEY